MIMTAVSFSKKHVLNRYSANKEANEKLLNKDLVV